jgi:hypothetical protein
MEEGPRGPESVVADRLRGRRTVARGPAVLRAARLLTVCAPGRMLAERCLWVESMASSRRLTRLGCVSEPGLAREGTGVERLPGSGAPRGSTRVAPDDLDEGNPNDPQRRAARRAGAGHCRAGCGMRRGDEHGADHRHDRIAKHLDRVGLATHTDRNGAHLLGNRRSQARTTRDGAGRDPRTTRRR